jgi:protein-tyrosine-phosphatase
MRIHVMCHGNGLRSIMAEAYLKSLNLPDTEVLSSGTAAGWYIQQGLPVSTHALEALHKHGVVQYAKRHRDQLTSEMVEADDIVICVSPAVFAEAQKLVTLPKQTYVWNVADIGEGRRVPGPGHSVTQVYEEMYLEIKADVDALLPTLIAT